MVTTTKFELLTRTVAARLDLPDARIVVVPHPLGGTDEPTIDSWARAAVDDLLAQISA